MELTVRILPALFLIGAIVGTAVPSETLAQSIVSPVTLQLADRLVNLTVPVDVIQRDAKAAYASNFRASFLRDPRGQAVMQRVPTLLDTAVRIGTSKFDEAMEAMWPDMKAHLAGSYAANLTPEELQVAVAFYSGPVGQKLVDAIPTLASGGTIAQILDTAEYADFAVFVRSRAGQKMEALKPQQTLDLAESMDRLLLVTMPEIQKAVAAEVRRVAECSRLPVVCPPPTFSER